MLSYDSGTARLETVDYVLWQWDSVFKSLRDSLLQAQAAMEKQEDQCCRDLQSAVGD